MYPLGTSLHASQPSGEHVSMCSQQIKYLVSYLLGTSRNQSSMPKGLSDLSWNTGFSDNFTQLCLLQYIQVASNWRSNKSDSSFLNHTASQLTEQAATYSASVVLSATQDLFLLKQEITPDPILKQHPQVLFLSMSLPSQSVSKPQIFQKN